MCCDSSFRGCGQRQNTRAGPGGRLIPIRKPAGFQSRFTIPWEGRTQAGIIRYSRSEVTILDQQSLENASCERLSHPLLPIEPLAKMLTIETAAQRPKTARVRRVW